MTQPLDPLLNPRSIAMIGASADPGRIGGMPLELLTRFGYAGGIYPVNPKYQEVFGRRCFPDIESVPEPVDLAVLAIAVWSEAKGRQSVEAFGRRIPSDVQRVALSVVAWGATIVALSTIVIAQITKADISHVLFDVISAFGTVGLSTGLTAELPDSASYVMAATIFMGRVGTVTLAAAVAATSRTQYYSLPVERPIVG